MKTSKKSRKAKPLFEINWKIRMIFSEAALDSYSNEIDNKYLDIEKIKHSFFTLDSSKGN